MRLRRIDESFYTDDGLLQFVIEQAIEILMEFGGEILVRRLTEDLQLTAEGRVLHIVKLSGGCDRKPFYEARIERPLSRFAATGTMLDPMPGLNVICRA